MRLLKRYFAMIALAAAYAAGQTTEPTTQLPTRSQVQDPGPRGGTPAAGGPISGLTPALQAVFTTGQANFQEVEDVPTGGLGPRFNSTSCSSCHFQPAIGGSSPASNPQVAFANSQNRLPSFITAKGPVREVRFISNPDGTPDGGVHDLFTIAGRSDTPQGCNLQQPDFSNSSNIIYRIPTPTFGLGLIEAIQDTTLIQNVAQSASQRLGIAGTLNRNGNDGTVTRFGWKAQNKSLLMFSGEAYNVEMGITNLLFNTERDETPDCSPLAPANSYWNIGGLVDQKVFDDITNFANFMRFLAAPTRAVAAAADNTAVEGSNQFVNIGCANCHTPALQTGASPFPGLANQTIHPYSDFALHHMGPGLADHISQGLAAGDQFRSAPLWGIGQRLFFLHDGRETDLMKVIADHASNANSQFPASEANQVVQNFNNLSNSDQQAILNFLRSL
ncbi:MAG TPA: di-heme oxidoredictase family protein [Bryobacteraceae bacterium]|nr:di-heme oxidoredictase family protein [Bryobacteraceae bacterium]